LPIANKDAKGPFTLVLNDDGSLGVVDKNDAFVTDHSFAKSMGFFGDGSINFPEFASSSEIDEYNARADALQRLINLKAYLRLIGYVFNEDTLTKPGQGNDDAMLIPPTEDTIADTSADTSADTAKDNPPYDPKVDYMSRIKDLLQALVYYGRISQQAMDNEINNIYKTIKNI
jgi:hypothetical protein